MNIDIAHVEASIRRFDKATRVLAAHASGIPEEELKVFPIIVCKSPEVWAVTISKSKPDPDFYTPYIVNASFCLEMLIKVIIFYERDEWIRGHNLLKLYQEISVPSKKKINDIYKKLHKEADSSQEISKLLKKKASIDIKWNVASLLGLSSTAFENWRYAFDTGKAKSCFIGYGEIYEALSQTKVSVSANK